MKAILALPNIPHQQKLVEFEECPDMDKIRIPGQSGLFQYCKMSFSSHLDIPYLLHEDADYEDLYFFHLAQAGSLFGTALSEVDVRGFAG